MLFLLLLFLLLALDGSQMLVEKLVGFWYGVLVPFLIRLAIAQQKNRIALWIKRKQNAVGSPACWMRNSFICECFDIFESASTCGRPSAGPFSCRRRTLALTDSCSSAER